MEKAAAEVVFVETMEAVNMAAVEAVKRVASDVVVMITISDEKLTAVMETVAVERRKNGQ